MSCVIVKFINKKVRSNIQARDFHILTVLKYILKQERENGYKSDSKGIYNHSAHQDGNKYNYK